GTGRRRGGRRGEPSAGSHRRPGGQPAGGQPAGGQPCGRPACGRPACGRPACGRPASRKGTAPDASSNLPSAQLGAPKPTAQDPMEPGSKLRESKPEKPRESKTGARSPESRSPRSPESRTRESKKSPRAREGFEPLIGRLRKHVNASNFLKVAVVRRRPK